MNTVGERIRTMRTALNLTQKEFCKNLGITQVDLSGIEIGKENPSDTLMFLICKEYGIKKNWLINGTGTEMFEKEPHEIPLMNKVYKDVASSHLRECGLPEDLMQGVDCSTYENMENSLQKVKESFYLAYVENVKEAHFFKRKSQKHIFSFNEMDCTENSNKYIADLHSILDNNSNIGRMTEEQHRIHNELHLLYEQIEKKMGNDEETKEIMFRYDEALGKQDSLLAKNSFIAGFKTAMNLFIEAMN